MGMSYTICYCINNKCKSRFGESKNDNFDAEHWSEITGNVSKYLDENVCVPGANSSVTVPSVVVDILNLLFRSLAGVRQLDQRDVGACLHALSRLTEALGRLSYLTHQINAGSGGEGLKLSRSLSVMTSEAPQLQVAEVDSGDEHLKVGALIIAAMHRLFYELMESKKLKDDIYVFHHLAMLLDAIQEFNRLAVESMCHLGSERFLPEGHAHYALLEKRWEQDGI